MLRQCGPAHSPESGLRRASGATFSVTRDTQTSVMLRQPGGYLGLLPPLPRAGLNPRPLCCLSLLPRPGSGSGQVQSGPSDPEG